MKSSSVEAAKKEAEEFLKKYENDHNYSYLEKALELDNTNSKIIFDYLNYLKQNGQNKFIDELKRYNIFLEENFCKILETKYINHKEDIVEFINLFQNIISDNLDIISLKKNLINILEKFYPRNIHELFEQKNEKRINNLPLDNIENDTILYLTIKAVLGKHLYSLADFEISEDDIQKKADILYIKNSLSYLKIYLEILKNYILKNERMRVFKLVNILDLDDYYFADSQSLYRVNFFLNDLKFDDNRIKNLAGSLYTELSKYPVNNDQVLKKQTYLDKYKELFFEFLEDILKSKCIKELVNQLKEHNKDKCNVISSDINYTNYIKYAKKNIMFFPFFNKDYYGLTITLNGKIILNDEYREIPKPSSYEQLYNFCIWIITGIHEAIGHFLKDYFSYLTKFVISEESASSDESSNGNVEGGNLVEELLFSNAKQFYSGDIFYILDKNNWNKSLSEFTSYFNSEERKKFIENGFKKEDVLNLSKELVELLSKFQLENFNLLNFKTNSRISLKRADSKPIFDFSERACVTAMKRKKKKK